MALSLSCRRRLFHTTPITRVLHHEWVGSNTNNNAIVFLHGLLGSGKNLKTLARRVVASNNTPGLLVDLRGHGRSDTFVGPHTFENCVMDVHQTLQNHAPSTIMGHSWGGRVGLQYVHSLLSNPTTTLPTLWLLDTVPGRPDGSVWAVLDAVQQIPTDMLEDRQQVAVQLQHEYNLQRPLAQWLASSIKRENNTYSWGFNVEVAKQVLEDFGSQDFVGMLQEILKEGGNVHLVRGGLNTAWEDNPRILLQLHELQQAYPYTFQMHTLPKAGHWVHVDDLPGLLQAVESTIRE